MTFKEIAIVLLISYMFIKITTINPYLGLGQKIGLKTRAAL